MSHRKLAESAEQGFTIVELVVVLVLTAIITTVLYSTFNTSLSQYLNLQENSSYFTELAGQSQRIANVLRGLTDITSVGSNDLTVYAYFNPNDGYVSLIRYYLGNGDSVLYADVTPMSSNPPVGTPITTSKRTYTVIDDFHKAPGVDLFNYLDSTGSQLALPVSDEHIIKGIRINLAVPAVYPTKAGSQTMTLMVSLRNRKTNL